MEDRISYQVSTRALHLGLMLALVSCDLGGIRQCFGIHSRVTGIAVPRSLYPQKFQVDIVVSSTVLRNLHGEMGSRRRN